MGNEWRVTEVWTAILSQLIHGWWVGGSVGRVQLVTLLLLSTHHLWISWQSTAGQTSVTLHSSSVGQLAEHSWSHSARWFTGDEWRVTEVWPAVLSQLTHWWWVEKNRGSAAKHSWSHFCYSPLITRGSAGGAQLVTLLLLSTHHPWVSWWCTAGHTSATLHFYSQWNHSFIKCI
jgi:hypothetical protein